MFDEDTCQTHRDLVVLDTDIGLLQCNYQSDYLFILRFLSQMMLFLVPKSTNAERYIRFDYLI